MHGMTYHAIHHELVHRSGQLGAVVTPKQPPLHDDGVNFDLGKEAGGKAERLVLVPLKIEQK